LKNVIITTSNIELGMRFELSFARFSVNARKSGKNYSFSESAGGGVIVDAKNKYVAFRNRGSVGRGGAIIIPFLDINCNGVMDEGESAISGISARVSGGISQFDEKSSTIRVTDLEPYTIYNIEVSASSTENISWQIPFKVIGVEAEPNKMKRVEIPVFPLGEASGMVNIKRGKSTEQGLGRIIVKFFTKDGNMIKSVLSEPDGYYSFLGLKPGEYYASLDSVQIGKLEMDVSEMTIPFTIQPSYDGDLVGGLDFTLLKEEVADPQPATQPAPQPSPQTVQQQAVQQQAIPQPAPKPAQTGGFRVQIYAFNVPMRDKEVLAKIMRFVPDLKIEEIKYPDGVYRYVSQSFANRAEAQKIINSLRRIGYKDTFIRED
jgi:hypothetical protein